MSTSQVVELDELESQSDQLGRIQAEVERRNKRAQAEVERKSKRAAGGAPDQKKPGSRGSSKGSAGSGGGT